jgi:hypothetical protein
MKPAAVFKQLSIIHIAICLGTCIIVGTLYTLKMQANEVISSEDGMNILELFVPVLGVITFAAAYYIGRRKIKAVPKESNLVDKLEAYKSFNIFIWAALEGSTFFAAIAFYLTGRTNLLLYALMLGVLLIYFRPLKTRAKEELNLSAEEGDELDL